MMLLAGKPAYVSPPFNDFVTPAFEATIEFFPIFKCGAIPTWPAKVQKSPISVLPATAKPAVIKQPLPYFYIMSNMN